MEAALVGLVVVARLIELEVVGVVRGRVRCWFGRASQMGQM